MKGKLQQILDGMEPGQAVAAIAPALKSILAHLDEEARVGFVTSLLEESGADKVASMVNL